MDEAKKQSVSQSSQVKLMQLLVGHDIRHFDNKSYLFCIVFFAAVVVVVVVVV